MPKHKLSVVEPHEDEKASISDALLIVARVWLYMALGAVVLYFIVKAIEKSHVTVNVSAVRAYRVPIEPTPETEDE